MNKPSNTFSKAARIVSVILTAVSLLLFASCAGVTEPTVTSPDATGESAPSETADAVIRTDSPETADITGAAQTGTPGPDTETPATPTPGPVPGDLLWDSGRIAAENARMASESDKITDIFGIPEELGAEEVKKRLTAASVPSLPKYDAGGAEITQEELDALLEARGVDTVNGTVRVGYAVAVARGNIRRLPTERAFYNSPENKLDRIQETEIYVGMPLRVLAESRDGRYCFVVSYYYSGWTLAENVAATDRETWLSFACPREFAVITRPLTERDGVYYDAGVVLPLSDRNSGGENGDITVLRPVRGASGELYTVDLTFSFGEARIGYAPFTLDNFLSSAASFKGIRYGWGGLDNGLDCSSFVASVLRVFGLYVPRDTSAQRSVVGYAIDVSAMSDRGKLDIIDEFGDNYPVIIYTKIHTQIFVGKENGSYIFSHAPGAGSSVKISERSDFSDVIYICILGRQ